MDDLDGKYKNGCIIDNRIEFTVTFSSGAEVSKTVVRGVMMCIVQMLMHVLFYSRHVGRKFQ